MCTALIYRNKKENLLGVGFNRDESVKRKISILPNVFSENNNQYLCPVDADQGGTWIGVNTKGEIFFLLNFYEAYLKLIMGPTSRGLLVRGLLSGEYEFSNIYKINLSNYYPFRLVKVTNDKTETFIWDGKENSVAENKEIFYVLGSSFTQGPKAEISRREAFNNFINLDWEKEFFENASKFLTSHEPEKGALSQCMHRRDAHTVSQTIIIKNYNKVEMKYKNSQPCETEEFTSTTLDLV